MPYFNNCTNGIWCTQEGKIFQSTDNPNLFSFNNIKNIAIRLDNLSIAYFPGLSGDTGSSVSMDNVLIGVLNERNSSCKIAFGEMVDCRYGVVSSSNSYAEYTDGVISGMFGGSGNTSSNAIIADAASTCVAFGASFSNFPSTTGPGSTGSYLLSINNSLIILSDSSASSLVQNSTTYSTLNGFSSVIPSRLIGINNYVSMSDQPDEGGGG